MNGVQKFQDCMLTGRQVRSVYPQDQAADLSRCRFLRAAERPNDNSLSATVKRQADDEAYALLMR